MPRPRARRRGVTSFSSWKTRRRLVLARGDEASPRCLVSTRGDTRYRPIPVGPHTGILSDRCEWMKLQRQMKAADDVVDGSDQSCNVK
ncbi:hypothetical protein GW17_00008846 [Ensete ventricosum]|nr:hypothetical protein GW17_00008846 [Ensete ventricosum]